VNSAKFSNDPGPSAAAYNKSEQLEAVKLLALLAVLLATAGCVTKSKAQADARAAYLAGQQEAMRHMQVTAPAQMITVMGPVRQSTIPWTKEMTLIKAIVAAQYVGSSDPTEIVIVRNGQGTLVDVQNVLKGQDVPLEPGDLVNLK
jgi:hypothetical protein